MATQKTNKKKLKKPLRQPPPVNQEKDYQKDLRYVVSVMREAINKYLIPKLDWLIVDFNKYKKRPLTDDVSNDLDDIFSSIKIYLDQKVDAKKIADKTAKAVNEYNAKNFQKQIQHVFSINIFLNEPWLEDQLKMWVNTNVGLIKSLEDQALQQVKYQVQSGFIKGLTNKTIAKNISERLDVANSRANLIGRDQVSKLNGQLNKERQQEIGVNSYIWNTSHDERVRPTHADNDGETFKWDEPPVETGHPGEDINCFLGNTPFRSFVNVRKFFRRRYSGKTTTIIASNGKSFRCTPNHPILTDRGFIAAKDIDIGDNIMCISNDATNIFGFSEGNIKNINSTFEQVFDFLSVIFPIHGISGTAEQFHGDGIINKNVDIITLETSLLDDIEPVIGKELREFFFSRADMTLFYLPTDRHIMNCLSILGFTSDSFMSFFSKLFSLFITQSSHSDEICLRAISDLNTIFNKTFCETLTGNLIFFRKYQYTLTRDIIFNNAFFIKLYEVGRFSVMMDNFKTILTQRNRKTIGTAFQDFSDFSNIITIGNHFVSVIEKRICEFSDSIHVYNIETNSNSYIIADDFIVSNCRCVAIPNFEESDLNKYFV